MRSLAEIRGEGDARRRPRAARACDDGAGRVPKAPRVPSGVPEPAASPKRSPPCRGRRRRRRPAPARRASSCRMRSGGRRGSPCAAARGVVELRLGADRPVVEAPSAGRLAARSTRPVGTGLNTCWSRRSAPGRCGPGRPRRRPASPGGRSRSRSRGCRSRSAGNRWRGRRTAARRSAAGLRPGARRRGEADEALAADRHGQRRPRRLDRALQRAGDVRPGHHRARRMERASDSEREARNRVGREERGQGSNGGGRHALEADGLVLATPTETLPRARLWRRGR